MERLWLGCEGSVSDAGSRGRGLPNKFADSTLKRIRQGPRLTSAKIHIIINFLHPKLTGQVDLIEVTILPE